MINTGLAINKTTAKKMAAEYFFKHKRSTMVMLYAYNVTVELHYTGSRKDEQAIREQVEIKRFHKKGQLLPFLLNLIGASHNG